MKKTRKKYDKEFKLMVVELYKNGKPAKEISQELGIGMELVCRWKRELDWYEQASFTGNGKVRQTEEQAEIARLKKELIETRIERDILKKAAPGARSASFPKATVPLG